MIAGFATAEGTHRFAARFPRNQASGFYRDTQALLVSNIGIGTYLGAMSEAADRGYVDSLKTAVRAGLNFIDTSLNYRHQRSERNVGSALAQLFEPGDLNRDEVVVCTKAGFLVPGAVPHLEPSEVVSDSHSMAPHFLDDQLERSRRNLGLETIDVFYLHNPEIQLGHVALEEFYSRIHDAFAFLERAVKEGRIRYYGTATWDGYRRRPGAPDGLDLDRLAAEAEAIGGPQHHFRFLQLPFNLAMPEAYVQGNVLAQAARLGIAVVASASMLQARLSRNLPPELAAKLPGASSDAQRAIQFTRSTPGISVALVGMSRTEHVHENLELAAVPPLSEDEYKQLYTQG